MADKKRTGSYLMSSLGRTKKEQMKAITPPGLKKSKTSTSVKSKAPYVRGKVMGKGDSTFEARRGIMGGAGSVKKYDKAALRDTAVIGAAAAAGFGVGKYDSSKKSKAKSHKGRAKQLADEAVKKQKKKKEKHHSR